MFFVIKTNTAGVEATFAVKEVLRLSGRRQLGQWQECISLLLFLPGHHPLISEVMMFFFFWFCFVSRDKNTQFWCIMKSRLVQRRGHKCHVSTLWRNYFLTFLETLRPDSWRTWSYRVHWLKAADFGSSIEDRQQYFQMFSSLVGQIRLALCSVKHIKILEHWNLSMTRQQVWI